jgi:hypothetical protein
MPPEQHRKMPDQDAEADPQARRQRRHGLPEPVLAVAAEGELLGNGSILAVSSLHLLAIPARRPIVAITIHLQANPA